MAVHKVRKGLDLPILGVPESQLEEAPQPTHVAVLGADFAGMRPTMQVAVGDSVRRGQLLFDDKKQAGVRHTSPGAGTVTAIHRGAKRAFQSVVIRLDPSDTLAGGDSVRFASFTDKHPQSLSRQEVRDLLLESGLWTSLRARPFGRVANPDSTPRSIFINAMDSEPLAPDLGLVADGREADLERGLEALAKLTEGKLYFCRAVGSKIEVPSTGRVQVEEFEGPHPAGTPGLHIHLLDPVDRNKLVWFLGLQDVLAIGHLFATGELDVGRIVAIGGPSVRKPRHLRTRLGADLASMLKGELEPDQETRVISGSVLSGRQAMGEVHGYLGRYDQQVSAIPEERQRKLLGWLTPGLDLFSIKSLFLSKLVPGKRFALGSSTHGSPRAIVPIGQYEKVMALDLMPTYLLKALVVGDIERAEELGCLELTEQDLALCTFVCPGKIDYGPYLRESLTILEKEG